MPMSEEVRQRMRAAGIRGRHAETIHRMTAVPEASPLDGVDYTGDLVVDSLAELDALMARFEQRERGDDDVGGWVHVTDSRHYAVLVFLTRADKEYFLLAMRVFVDGDLYLSGPRLREAAADLPRLGPAPVRRAEAAKEIDPDEDVTGFRGRARDEEKRFRIATDTGYWVAVCWASAGDLETWLTGLPPQALVADAYLDGYVVARSYGIEIPEDLI